ncbi:PEP-CTERM sorting domain-containing protein [bacterium]|nr:PEP-CTERM sorting domain-containing protein [bacterium]
MKTSFLISAALAALVTGNTASAHLGFTGSRNFDTLALGVTETSSDRTVGGAYGWADGTDANFGDSHRETFFRFVLSDTTDVTVAVARRDGTQTGATGVLLPGFSLYRIGSGTMPTSTHDGATASVAQLTSNYGTNGVAEAFTDSNTDTFWTPGESFTDTNGNGVWDSAGLGNSGKEGCFNALGDWKMFNDAGELGDFRYVGHAVDGGAGNYGLASGINGDGVADGLVTASFNGLVAGEYFIAVGGATYADQINFKNSGQFGTTGVTYPTYGITVSVTAIPEPSSAVVLAGVGALGVTALRRRRSV